jgi:hypothetical protein
MAENKEKEMLESTVRQMVQKGEVSFSVLGRMLVKAATLHACVLAAKPLNSEQ